MDTKTMINQLKYEAEKHKNDSLFTGQTNITALCNDVIPKLGKLAEYENAEEEGLLIRLPCKVGDTVYCTEFMEDMGIIKGNVCGVSLDKKVWISVRYENGLLYHHPEKTIGKTLFLTREEAEKSLKEMEGKE